MPKLRKNRRIESRWGVEYYTAVRNAVFVTQAQTYVPASPPPFVKQYIPECETLYMCVQCKDCFHFRSSLEDHIARKSWILGYWCPHCFVTTCRHNPKEASLCSVCIQTDHEKRSYLQSRGLRKGQKFGVVRLFYNQCQFFAHLKTHNVNMVHMGDLMLMPLPTSINGWNLEVDLTCEALMEHTFIIKVHIMDWLKDKKISDNWWKLTASNPEDNNNPVALILKRYKGRHYFKPLEIPTSEQFSTLNCPYSTSKNANSDTEILDSAEKVAKRTSPSPMDTVASVSDESVIENEDSPYTVNDIAFVDCGLASKYLDPEIPLSNSKKKSREVSIRSIQDSFAAVQPANMVTNKFKKSRTRLNCSSPNMVMSYGNIIITPKHDTKDSSRCPTDKQSWKSLSKSKKSMTPIKVGTESNTVKVDSDKKVNDALTIEASSRGQSGTPCATKRDTCPSKRQNVHTLTVNSGQKVVTIQSAKHVDINTIISQLPPHITNNKKIVFIKQSSDNATVPSNRESPSKTVVHLVPHENEKLLEMKKNLENEKLSQVNEDLGKSVLKNRGDPTKDKVRSSPSKVVYQNGRKYIIKQSVGSAKTLRSVPNAMIKNSQGTVQSKCTNGVPPLIPLNSAEIENMSNQERMNSFHGDVSPLTPSPSPSELSSSSSCDVQSRQFSSSMKSSQKSDCHLTPEHNDISVDTKNMNSSFETLSFYKGEDQNLYLNIKFNHQKPIYTIVDTATMITRCKEEMLNEFFHLSYFELKKRYDHLQQISEEISRVMNFVTENVVRENLKAVHILQTVLKHCINKCDEGTDDAKEIDESLDEWESEYQHASERPVCKACNKITKPKQYIPGFSKLAENDIYCCCYRHLCHKCYRYQGNSTRFVAHQTFHDKEKPYLCPDCYRKFTTYKSLEVHTWTTCFHTLKKRVLGCKICEVDGFQDMESIARHFAIMHGHNRIACDKCYVILPSYSEYRKHCKDKHPDAVDLQPIRLVLCKLGRCIVRCEDYMSHMEKHSVVQRLIWFKCPFCTFIHVEAKRIMSHLQSGHDTRMNELISSDVLVNILQVEAASSLLKSNQQQTKFTNAYAKSCENGAVMPKIVNARTITSEVFERGAHGADDYLTSSNAAQCPEGDNASSSLESSKLSPRIVDVRSVADTTNHSKCVTNGTAEAKENKEEENKARRRGESSKKVSSERTYVADTVKIEPKDTSAGAWNNETKETDYDVLCVESLRQHFPSRDSKDEIASDTSKIEASLEKEKVQKIKTEQTNDVSEENRHVEGMQQGSISGLPPLIRIPEHVFHPSRSKKFGQATKGGQKTVAGPRDRKTRRDLSQRIALNSPNNSNEIFNFSCHLCGELISTYKPIVYDHFRNKHSQDCKLSIVTTDLLRVTPEFINGGYKELLSNKKRKSDCGTSTSKRRRRWTPKKYSDRRNANFAGLGLCVKQETAEDSEGNFRCKKCDQLCTDMAHLREHIASNHRIKGRYLVCLECGDNFVVAPSLQMHLKAFHGIEDPIAYMAQNTSYAPDNVDDLETGGKAIEANQCHVCMAVFENKAAVDKHLRVHGMAFLNRKRIEARNALKSPEKKNEEEEEEEQEEKQTPGKPSPKEPVRKDKPAETILEKISATI